VRTLPILLFAALPLAAPAKAHELQAGPVVVGHPWTRPTSSVAVPAVGYMTLENHGPADDRLLSAESLAAGTVTMHRTEVRDGVARMLPQEEGIAIPAHGSVSLEPGGYHLMLGNSRHPSRSARASRSRSPSRRPGG
jgi:copper(I)-binding protein